MTSHLYALCFDALDPHRLAHFWAGVLRGEMAADADNIAILPSDDTGFRIRFVPTRQQKTGQNPDALRPHEYVLEDGSRGSALLFNYGSTIRATIALWNGLAYGSFGRTLRGTSPRSRLATL